MQGNVSEFCAEVFLDQLPSQQTGLLYRAYRGGSLVEKPEEGYEVDFRFALTDSISGRLGARVVLDIQN